MKVRQFFSWMTSKVPLRAVAALVVAAGFSLAGFSQADDYRDKIQEIRARKSTPAGYSATVSDLPRAGNVINSDPKKIEATLGGKPNSSVDEVGFSLQRVCRNRVVKELVWKYSVSSCPSLRREGEFWLVSNPDAVEQTVFLLAGFLENGKLAAVSQIWKNALSTSGPMPLVPHLRVSTGGPTMGGGATYLFSARMQSVTGNSTKGEFALGNPVEHISNVDPVNWKLAGRSKPIRIPAVNNGIGPAGMWIAATSKGPIGVGQYVGYGWNSAQPELGTPLPPTFLVQNRGSRSTWIPTMAMSVAISSGAEPDTSRLAELANGVMLRFNAKR